MAPSPANDKEDDLRPEYDFSQMKGWVRGRHAGRVLPGTISFGSDYEQTSGIPRARPATQSGMTPEEVDQFLRRMTAELKPIFHASTTPIQFVDPEGFTGGVAGTGTLVRVADKFLLVTAWHVFADARDRGCDLWISDAPKDYRNGSKVPGVPLAGLIHGDIGRDVAAMELGGAAVEAMRNRQFLTWHHTDRLTRPPLRGAYYVHGYPDEISKTNAHSHNGNGVQKVSAVNTDFTVCAGLYAGATGSFPGYDPYCHILLDADPIGLQVVEGTRDDVPSRLHGMSGCAIWRGYYEGISSRHWTTNDASIVAVQTGVYNNGAIIKGTRWWVVDRIIRDAYPELAGPLDLAVPDRRPVGAA